MAPKSKMAKGEMERLIQILSRLPGMGPRSARRAVLFMLKRREGLMLPLAEAMRGVAQAVKSCELCGNLDDHSPCFVCENNKRDTSQICVVEEVGDLWALERSGAFKGRYHVLGGTLSALDGRGPEDLKIGPLLARAKAEEVTEVILALSATVDGQTTVHYLMERLADCGVKVTRIGRGVPMGGSLDYLDDGTLTAALRSRRGDG